MTPLESLKSLEGHTVFKAGADMKGLYLSIITEGGGLVKVYIKMMPRGTV